MFRRVILEEWTTVVPIISFCFFFAIFVYTTIRALRMADKNREHLASLPLDNPESTSTSH